MNLSVGIDKVGRVVLRENRILRDISPEFQNFFRSFLQDGELMDSLYQCGLVRTAVAESSESRLLVEHEYIERQTFWPEWSFDMLKDAALLTVRLTLRLLANGMCLKDAHPYNVLFRGCTPVFVDLGSIVPGNRGYEDSWAVSFHSEFFLPLLCLRAGRKQLAEAVFHLENTPRLKELIGRFGIHLPPWLGIFPRQGGFVHALEALGQWLVNVQANNYSTTWEDYYARGQLPDIADERTYTNKERAAARFMLQTRAAGCTTLLDAASNEGWFARLALTQGFRVVALDYDERAINNLYCKLGQTAAGILPVVMNFKAPTPPHGLRDMWPAAQSRLASDVTLAMAVVHHLALGQGMTFAEFAGRLFEFTRRFVIVEFIDPSDIHIRKRAKRKPWYNEQEFLKAMGRHFKKLDEAVSEPGTRKVMLFAMRH